MRFLIIAIMAFSLSACAVKVPENTFVLNDSILKDRQRQTKKVDREYKTLISESVSALQDMGFVVEKADEDIGYIHAFKTRELTTGFQAGAAEFGVNFLAALAGTQGNYRHPQKINVQAYLLLDPQGKQSVLRTTFFNTTLDRLNVILSHGPVDDAEIYQSFYNKVGQSYFLEDHLND